MSKSKELSTSSSDTEEKVIIHGFDLWKGFQRKQYAHMDTSDHTLRQRWSIMLPIEKQPWYNKANRMGRKGESIDEAIREAFKPRRGRPKSIFTKAKTAKKSKPKIVTSLFELEYTSEESLMSFSDTSESGKSFPDTVDSESQMSFSDTSEAESRMSFSETAESMNSVGTSVEMPRAPVSNDPLYIAAHFALLGDALSSMGKKLERETVETLNVDECLTTLLDTLVCASGPLMCLTTQVKELDVIPKETLDTMMDNIGYIMPIPDPSESDTQ